MNAKLREYAQEIFDEDVQLEFRPSKQTKKGDERYQIRHAVQREGADIRQEGHCRKICD